MELSEGTRTIVIAVSVGIGSFAIVLGIVITCLICRRKRRELTKRRNNQQRSVRYDKRNARRYGQPGAPSAGSSSGKAHRSKHRVNKAPSSTDNPPHRLLDDPLQHVDVQHGGRSGGGGGGWHALMSGHPAPFKSNSLPGATQLSTSFPRYETQLANRHRDRFGYTGKTVSEPYDQQSIDTKWQDNYPGRPRQLLRAASGDMPGSSWPRYAADNVSYDSRSINSYSMYHNRLYGGGRDFTGAGFMSQSIDKSLNGLRRSSQSLYYDGRT